MVASYNIPDTESHSDEKVSCANAYILVVFFQRLTMSDAVIKKYKINGNYNLLWHVIYS